MSFSMSARVALGYFCLAPIVSNGEIAHSVVTRTDAMMIASVRFKPGSVVFRLLLLAAVLSSSACATKVPKYSHIHVGHSLTGWVNTPENKGLFVTAEELANEIARLSVDSIDASRRQDFDVVRRNSKEINRLIGDDSRAVVTKPEDYTFLTALQGSINHMQFASESDDASSNLQEGVKDFTDNVGIIFARTEVLTTLAEVTASETDADRLTDIVREIRVLAVQNLEGEDINDSGHIGDTPEEYGLRQLRRDMAATIKKEDPPYRAIEQRYLFGLVRLPDGTWAFKDPGSGGGAYGTYSY
jgi:hypothetical protein